MSHWVDAQVEFKDLAALEAAVKELGCALEKGGIARGWGNSRVKADYAIKLPGRFDVQVNLKNGGMELITDWYDGSVARQLGKDYSKLKQVYAIHKVTMEQRKRGHMVTRKNMEDGSINLEIVKVGGAA